MGVLLDLLKDTELNVVAEIISSTKQKQLTDQLQLFRYVTPISRHLEYGRIPLYSTMRLHTSEYIIAKA